MKKIIGVLLCFAVIVSCCGIGAFAAEDKNDDPIILISGFLCTQLYKNYATESEEKVWIFDVGKVTDRIGDDLPRFLKTFAGLAVGKTEDFGKALGEGARDILDDLSCNPDGSSKYPVTHYPNDPATSNIEYMLANGEEENVYEKNFCKYLAGLADASKVYCFQYDSRLDAITIAGQLNDFVEKVKEYTGSERVRIFALSYGGLISSSYLCLYGDSSVSKLIMSVPALGGTNLPDSLFRGEIDFPVENLVEFFETVLGLESNFARLFEGDELEKINAVIKAAVPDALESLKYWGSIWSLCLADLYDELKADFLDPIENKAIIEKTDKIHYEIMPAIPATLKNAQANGVDVAILCGTGSSIAVGGELNGDVILPASKVSGATCAPLGQRFANGYTGIKTTCSNPDHVHVSPSMEVDASSAYLPENTWFIDGQYHGQYYYEEYTRSLVTKLLLTYDIKDVYSDPDFPQFEYSNHAYRNIHVKFNQSGTGYLSAGDTALIIKNISTDNSIKILSVTLSGAELDFDVSQAKMLSSGETVEIPFSGEIPETGATASQITVSYIEVGSINPLCVDTFDIMINNGEAAEASGLAADESESAFKAALPEWIYNLLVKASLRQSVECVYNAIVSIFD